MERDCGCCDGIEHSTPLTVENSLGLSSLQYRVGTHSRFKESILASISMSELPSMAKFRARNDDDPSVALVDAVAGVCDVLTFYQERIAHESWIRTSTEDLSLTELGRLVGFVPIPGVSANAYVVFDFEDAPGAPLYNPVPIGTKVQSVPGPGEQPQLFETTVEFTGRSKWNQIQVRSDINQTLTDLAPSLILDGIPALRPGDMLMYRTSNAAKLVCARVTRSIVDSKKSVTTVMLGGWIDVTNRTGDASLLGAPPVGSIGPNAAALVNTIQAEAALTEAAKANGWNVEDLFNNLAQAEAGMSSIIVFRVRSGIFGNTTRGFDEMPTFLIRGQYIQKPGTSTVEWLDGPFSKLSDKWIDKITSLDYFGQKKLPLDSVQSTMAPGTVALIENGSKASVYGVVASNDVGKVQFDTNTKVTELELNVSNGLSEFTDHRHVRVYGQPETLALAKAEITAPIAGQYVDLDTFYSGFATGQSIYLTGEDNAQRGVTALEHAEISFAEHHLSRGGFTRLHLSSALKRQYVPSTTKTRGNVVHADRGGSVSEVLGSGDARKTFQRFALKQSPLSYVLKDGSTASTLRIFVDDIEWRERSTLFTALPQERVFAVIREASGKTWVQFGDGVRGSRLPTGPENVKATYRTGTGSAANVAAGQLTTALTPPIGFRQVTNLEAATDGADAMRGDQVRQSVATEIRTLRRVVSLQDYEDQALTIAGVAKARAGRAWRNGRRGVLITVARQNGALLVADSLLHKTILQSLTTNGDPAVPVWVQPHRDRRFKVQGGVKIHADYSTTGVLAEIETLLRSKFGFDARSFGQVVPLSEVVAIIQSVEGVVMVDVDSLKRTDMMGEPPLPMALPSDLSVDGATGDELLTIDSAPLTLTVIP